MSSGPGGDPWPLTTASRSALNSFVDVGSTVTTSLSRDRSRTIGGGAVPRRDVERRGSDVVVDRLHRRVGEVAGRVREWGGTWRRPRCQGSRARIIRLEGGLSVDELGVPYAEFPL